MLPLGRHVSLACGSGDMTYLGVTFGHVALLVGQYLYNIVFLGGQHLGMFSFSSHVNSDFISINITNVRVSIWACCPRWTSTIEDIVFQFEK